MKVALACAPASARLSIGLQAMRLSYFKNSDFTPSLQRSIMLRVARMVRYAARSQISVCNNVCARAPMKAA